MFQQMGGCSIDFGEKYEAKVDVIVRNERMYIKVKNTGESDSYIRLAIFNVSNLVIDEKNPSLWSSDSDGFFYYDAIVKSGETTEELIIKFDSTSMKETNTARIAEIIGVTYGYDGEAIAEWDRKIELN